MKEETPIQQVINHYLDTRGFDKEDISAECKKDRTFYAKHLRNAKDLLELAGNVERAKEEIDKMAEWSDSRGLDFNLNTVIKKWLEDK